MMQKTARNDPCPCGSQKKYKQCCLTKIAQISSFETDREWQKLREMEGQVWANTFEFVSKEWSSEIIEDGWDAFCLDEEMDRSSNDGEHFFPGWFIFRWHPYDYSDDWEHFGENTTIAEACLEKTGLTKYQDFLSVISESPFSFFLVEDIVPARRMVLKDLLLDRTITIKEKSGAVEQAKGSIIFARVISYKNQDIQIGQGTTFLPLRYAQDVLDLRKAILKQEKKLTPTNLLKYDDALREAYFTWSESAYQLPTIRNNDGDPIELSTLRYRLNCSAEHAFDQLIPLCKGEDPEEALQDGLFDEQGQLDSIQFSWLKNRSTNIILADIKIEGQELTIHVNSAKRSKKVQAEIKKRLHEAELIDIDTQPLDLAAIKEKSTSTVKHQASEEEKTMMHHFMIDYYMKWLDTPLPILNGKTPRQAVNTKEGKERVEFLMLEFEFGNGKKEDYEKIDVTALRRELGLTPLLLQTSL